jgi:hypothetical protein
MSSYPADGDEYDPEIENLSYETKSRKEKNKFHLPGFKWTTTTDLTKYAQDKFEFTDILLPTTPKMLEIIDYMISPAFKRKTLYTELNLAMLEILLDLPIMWNIELDNGEEIDLNDITKINLQDQCFDQAIEILNELLKAGVVREEELRISLSDLQKRSKNEV